MLRVLVRLTCLLLVIGGILSLGGVPVAQAQGGDTTALNIGDNKLGEVTAAQPTPAYALTILTPQTIDLQVLAVTPGFAPALRVFDPAGILIQTVTNTSLATAVQVRSLEVGPGQYRIEVQSANGQPGQFVLGVQVGETLPAPLPLVLGQSFAGNASSETQRQRYAFTGSATDMLLLYVTSELPGAAPVVSLRDADTLETLAITSARVAGVRFLIPAGATGYLVEVANSGASVVETFTICLENENGSGPRCAAGAAVSSQPTATTAVIVPSPTAVPQPLPPLPATGACVIASATGGSVNVRSGPGTEYGVLFQLSGNALAAVTGRLADGSWFQASLNGVTGWASASVVRTGGQCGSVPVVGLTPPTVAAPTAAATAAPSNTPMLQPSVTATATATATATPAVVATLNFSLPPNYGSTSLTSGFVPDPYTVSVTSGGAVNVSYLGSGCNGYATSAPDFSVSYTAGAFPTLRFYFIGSGDTTLIINTPSGSYVCVDDSFGTLNPTIDFNSPSSGRYDIWVGSYAEGTFVPGTLYVTENTGNHP
ncbi:MAG: SH3 domain-containing protein [Anaerolineae bacterium]|nr:SH3 domain-containing protein [Anaerolineae bacterium]